MTSTGSTRACYQLVVSFWVAKLGLFALALGLVVVLGWHTHNATLVQVVPGFVLRQPGIGKMRSLGASGLR